MGVELKSPGNQSKKNDSFSVVKIARMARNASVAREIWNIPRNFHQSWIPISHHYKKSW
jgi:hypothetical protein